MILDDVENRIGEIVNRFEGDINTIFIKVSKIISEWMLTNEMSTMTSLEFDRVFNDALSRAGYYEVVNKMIDEDYNHLFSLIEESFAAGGTIISYTSDDLSKIMALKALDKNKFSVLASTAGTSLRESLVKYSLSDYSAVDMQKDIQKEFIGTNLYKHSKTIADSSISEFHQAVTNIKASEYDDLVWVYRGKSIDGKTRDYCKCILKNKKYYQKNDKLSLENNSKRKYNCRHWFNAVTEDYARHKGFSKATSKGCS